MSAYRPAAYGDGCAPFYDQLYPSRESGLLDALAALAGSEPALDLGIGTGRVALPLARRGVRVHGVEASLEMLARFRERAGAAEVPVVEGDFAEAELGGPFGLAYALVSTLYLLPTLALQRACLANVARHLRPGGLLLAELFSGRGSFPRPEVTESPIVTPTGVRLYRVTTLATPLEVLDAMASECGLRLDERWADWRRAPWVAASPRAICLYRRA